MKIDWNKIDWKKVKPFKSKVTYGETLGPAMKITDPKEAQEYFIRLVAHARLRNSENKPMPKSIQIVGSNLGYYAGYYDGETAQRVMRLFNCEHPIFGKKRPDAKEAFNAGMKMGKALTSAGK